MSFYSLLITFNKTILLKINSLEILLALVSIFFIIVLYFYIKSKKPKIQQLDTEYQKNLDINSIWQEYPRPQLQRNSYLNLNGQWDYKITKDFKIPTEFDGQIIVPYPIESSLSGVKKQLKKGEFLFYRKYFNLPKDFKKEIVLLNFGAVDQVATIYINQKEIMNNNNGYLPFSVNITDFLNPDINEIIVRVKDDLELKYPHGKQSKKRGGIWYTPISGIWQTVWIESVSKDYIKSLAITPNIDNNEVIIKINSQGINKSIKVYDENDIIIERSFTEDTIKLIINNPKLWTPETPFLYRFELNTDNDKITSYFALRKFSIGEYNNKKCFLLNNKPYFHNGLLDQGYYSDGIYLPATIDGFIDDITKMKELGFNTLRKHIKVEPLLWYYLCDKIGMIVWQDMVNNSNYSMFRDTILPTLGKNINDELKKVTEEEKQIFIEAMENTVSLLYNTPSIALWTIFNEGWGQFNSNNVYKHLKTLDSTRIIDSTSGWFKQGQSDVNSLHIYFKNVKIPIDDKPIILSEFGGYSYKIPKNSFNLSRTFGYRFFNNKDDYNKALINLYEEQVIPNIKNGLTAAIYTQVSDVEDETNGLLTYDRKICKVDVEKIKEMNSKVHFK